MSGTRAHTLKRSPYVHVQRPGREEKGVSFRFLAYLRQRFEVKEFTCEGDTTDEHDGVELDRNGRLPMGIPHSLVTRT
jgi:hypothetical protein